MQTVTEAFQLLTWPWVAVIAIVAFCRPLGRFLDRASVLKIGKKGISAKAPKVPKPGELTEPSGLRGDVRELIETRRFVLLDAAGKKRAELGTTDTDSALLVLYDATGRSRVALFASKTGASVLAFDDEHGKPRVLLASSDPTQGSTPEELTAAFSLRNSEGDVAASLFVDAGGNPALDLFSSSGVSLFNAQ